MQKFISKKTGIILLVLAGIYLLYFHNIWSFKLLDVDETRYVDMAKKMFENKEFLTLYLNGEYFFEKPPLYFWVENLFFFIFGRVSEGIARLPIALQALFAALSVFFVGSKIVSKKFGLVSALILATSLEFIIMSKIAMLDMLLASCIIISVFSGFMTFFAKDKNKKYFWWLFYLFSALGVMAKGIPGFVVPFGTMFLGGIYSKKFKEFFKPQYLLVGLFIFFVVVLPWHVVMFKTHDPLFYQEYIIKHHLERFAGAEVIDRARPFYYYFLTIAWGFIPWIFSLIAILAAKIKNYKNIKIPAYADLDKEKQFLALNVIGAAFTLLFFSSSGTKLITYILPIYAFLAVIVTPYWMNEGKKKIFIVLTSVMIFLTAFITPLCFSIDYKFGQNDLMEFAQDAKVQHKNIVTYKNRRKYSLLYYSDSKTVKYLAPEELNLIPKYLDDKNTMMIVRNKDLDLIEKELPNLKFKVLKSGVKFSVIGK